MGLLDGKVAVVTGSGLGIGRSVALLFASEGAQVVINDVGVARDGSGSDPGCAEEVAKAIKKAGGQAVVSTASVTTQTGAESIVKTAVDAFGKLDILVNNAGILQDKTLLKMSSEQWDSVLAVHLTGTFFCTQAAANQMRAQKSGGRIINTTSIAGMLGNFGQANYAAAKAGIYGLTRTASIELQRYGILVNAVAPLAKTRMTSDLPMFEKLGDTMTPDHIAPAHLFLASELSAGRTGLVLSVAGGKMSVFKVVESAGKFKEADGGRWTAQEIAEHWDAIAKV